MMILLTERVYLNGKLGEKPVLIRRDDIEMVRFRLNPGGETDQFGNAIIPW